MHIYGNAYIARASMRLCARACEYTHDARARHVFVRMEFHTAKIEAKSYDGVNEFFIVHKTLPRRDFSTDLTVYQQPFSYADPRDATPSAQFSLF